jgi:hypothetical protein
VAGAASRRSRSKESVPASPRWVPAGKRSRSGMKSKAATFGDRAIVASWLRRTAPVALCPDLSGEDRVWRGSRGACRHGARRGGRRGR